jgi:hypothetical protein
VTVAQRVVELQAEPVRADRISRALYRLLDAAFGQDNWQPNEDARYLAELEFQPIDVIAPLEQHAALYEKASEIERRMLREYNARVLIFVVDPGSQEDGEPA